MEGISPPPVGLSSHRFAALAIFFENRLLVIARLSVDELEPIALAKSARDIACASNAASIWLASSGSMAFEGRPRIALV